MDHDAINERCARDLLAWLDQQASARVSVRETAVAITNAGSGIESLGRDFLGKNLQLAEPVALRPE